MQKKVKIIIGIGIFLVIGAIGYTLLPTIFGDILYPLEYEEHIIKYSKENDLDPTFVAALIYTESRFHSDSVSGAGAIGLMQIMPATAQGIAQRLGVTDFNTQKLYDPETSIRFGTYYIKQKIDEYNGNTNAALAAYNGGNSVANRYIVSGDLMIPNETKNFIVRVNTAKEKYTNLYANILLGVDASQGLKVQKEPTILLRLLSFLGF